MTPNALLPALLMFAVHSPLAGAADYLRFSDECERALARSALPVHLRERANVHVLGAKGPELRDADEADFSCIVARNHPGSIIPQCFDRPGQRAILPKFLDEAGMLAAGKTFAQIKETIDARLDSGSYLAADGPGLVYMMSPYNYIYAANAGRLLHVHPHVMFHAPHLEVEAVGNNFAQSMDNIGLPFVIDAGVHGYMVSMVERAADASEVDAACEGQLPQPPAK